MTVGGIATLYVCFDNLFADKFLRCNANTDFGPIRNGLKWLDKNFDVAMGGHQLMGHGDLFYYLYGVERVGLASGYKYFGTHDWYTQGAIRLISLQGGGGAWAGGKRGAVVSTAFALLFLVRGQHAVAFNKLEFDGDWNNRPRDMAGLTRWMSDSFERTLNWQIVNLKVPTEEWHDAPILYLSGSQDPNMTDEQVAKLRRYVWQGGTILSVTECGGSGFRKGIRSVYQRMLPEMKLRPMRRDHPVYSIHHKMYGWPTMYEIHNGIRPLVTHTDMDLSKSWQLQLRQTSPRAFQVAANVLMYVTDKGQLRNRGVSHWPRKPKEAAGERIKIARLKYGGNWDPEPLAYERFARLMAWTAKAPVEVVGPVEIAQLDVAEAKIATLTGTEKVSLSASQASALRKFVAGGGTLIIDAAGGSREFARSMDSLLASGFGRSRPRRLSTNAAIYKLAGKEIREVGYRRKARVDRGLRRLPNLRGIEAAGGRVAVIYSTEDLTAGLVGYQCVDCIGYVPDSCFELMRNAVLHAAGRTAKKPTSGRVSAR